MVSSPRSKSPGPKCAPVLAECSGEDARHLNASMSVLEHLGPRAGPEQKDPRIAGIGQRRWAADGRMVRSTSSFRTDSRRTNFGSPGISVSGTVRIAVSSPRQLGPVHLTVLRPSPARRSTLQPAEGLSAPAPPTFSIERMKVRHCGQDTRWVAIATCCPWSSVPAANAANIESVG